MYVCSSGKTSTEPQQTPTDAQFRADTLRAAAVQVTPDQQSMLNRSQRQSAGPTPDEQSLLTQSHTHTHAHAHAHAHAHTLGYTPAPPASRVTPEQQSLVVQSDARTLTLTHTQPTLPQPLFTSTPAAAINVQPAGPIAVAANVVSPLASEASHASQRTPERDHPFAVLSSTHT